MNLRVRITCGFLIIVLVMTSVAGIIIWQGSKMQQAFQHSSQINEIEKYFLECRRQEKNFLLRQDEESVKLFSINYAELIDVINETSESNIDEISIEKLNSLKYNLISYNEQFNDIAKLKELVVNDNRVKKEVTLARENHLLIEELNVIATNSFDKAHSITVSITIFSIIIGLFLSVVIAGFISTKIMDILRDPDDYLLFNH